MPQPTITQVRQALGRVVRLGGDEAAEDVLAPFFAERVSEVEPEDFRAVIAACATWTQRYEAAAHKFETDHQRGIRIRAGRFRDTEAAYPEWAREAAIACLRSVETNPSNARVRWCALLITAARELDGPAAPPIEVTPIGEERSVARQSVYRAIDSERRYQDEEWPANDAGLEGAPPPLAIGESLLLFEEYAARARAIWSGEDSPETKTLHVIRKLAGIAVRCMEHHGSPRRERS